MEKDDEVKGSGNSYTTHFRQYDSRISRWLSVDPRIHTIPWQSPYIAMDNNPILLNDPKGDCPQCLTGALTGLFTELVTQVGTNMLIKGMSFSEATKSENINKFDLLIATIVGGAEGAATGGVSKFVRFFSKKRNRKIAGLHLEKSVDVVFDMVENIIKKVNHDNDFTTDDLKNSLYETFVNLGMSSILSKKIMKNYRHNQRLKLKRLQKMIGKAKKRGYKPDKKYIEALNKAKNNLRDTEMLEKVVNMPADATSKTVSNVIPNSKDEKKKENER